MNFAKYATIHARHLPDKVCLIERTPTEKLRRTLTWKQYNDEINKVANYLSKELGVKDNDTVMHLQYNSLEWLITYFAIIKIGAVVVPLNFRFAGSDVLSAAEISQPKVFFLGSEFLPLVESIQKELNSIEHFICVGENSPEGMIDYRSIQASDDTQEALIDLEGGHHLALMFTSGTTGAPKPVVFTHYAINNVAVGNGMSFFVQTNDNYIVFLPLFHSGAMFMYSPYYATGAAGTLLLEFKEPKWIFEALEEEKGTATLFVVPLAVLILNQIRNGDIRLSDYDLSKWRYLGMGAQPIPFDVLKELMEEMPCGVSNIYGSTEGGGGGTFRIMPEDVLQKPGSIGKPTFGVESKVVDSSGREVPAGEVGELILSTERMMKEYLNNPELTRECLQDGWHYSGDLAKIDPDGFFFIVDRKKDMITSGGENIYPVEIENALMEHPKIDDVACIGSPDDRFVEVVLAIVQVQKGETLTEDDLIEYAKSRLATYKIPRKVIFDQVMRNPTGKLMKPEMREKFTGRREAFQSLG